MKLYYIPGACPLVPHIVLEWIGKPFEAQEVSRTEVKEPKFLAMNPTGQVPVLVDGNLTLTQNASILEYLAELNPKAKLMGETLQERAETRRWFGFCNSDLHRTFSIVFAAPSYIAGAEGQAELISNTKKKVIAFFRIADKQLAGKSWLTGARSIADPYLYTLLRWAKAKELDLSDCANLQAFFTRMNADSGVKTALKAQGLS
ncbi:MAG: glutathione S-transferase N-terminal domain-containing protein [Burkholderiaceae bacterium]